jgi:peptidyl-prolyl cis-trans isomerase B (cyclophilin B)
MGVEAMRSRTAAIVILCVTLVSIAFPASADTNGKKATRTIEDVVCVDNPVAANSKESKRVALPSQLMKRPPRFIDLVTNCGVITIRPDFGRAPVAVTFMSSLVQQKYFDLTSCHRLTTDVTSFIQCGDPTGTGMGDKVFTYQKENLPKRFGKYREGTVALQNRNGISSQFLIFYEETTLSPNHSVWGRITSGIEILHYISEGGIDGGGTDGKPMRTLVIERAVLR